jgi:hypothetical protein
MQKSKTNFQITSVLFTKNNRDFFFNALPLIFLYDCKFTVLSKDCNNDEIFISALFFGIIVI